MEVRFPTYTLRELQRAAYRPAEEEDAFIEVIGNLGAETEHDLSQHSPETDLLPQQSSESQKRARMTQLGAEAIAAVTAPREETSPPPVFTGLRLGQRVDVRA